MSLIQIPAGVKVRRVEWQRNDPAQVNRSEWTGKRQVTILPTAAKFDAKVELVPLIGEANGRPLRSMLSRLRGVVNRLKVPAVETMQTSAATYPIGNRLALSNRANTTVTGRSITKSSGSAAWDAAAYSASNAGSLVVCFRAGSTDASFLMGMTRAQSDNGVATIEFAIGPSGNGQAAIWEGGTAIVGLGGYTPDTIFALVYDGTSITYYIDGFLARRVSMTAGQTFFMAASLFTIGAAALDVLVTVRPTVLPFTLSSFNGSQPAALADGMMATLLLQGGGSQLVTIEGDMASDANGYGVPTYWPPARAIPYAVATGMPFAAMTLKAPNAGHAVDPGQLYTVTGASLDLEEAI